MWPYFHDRYYYFFIWALIESITTAIQFYIIKKKKKINLQEQQSIWSKYFSELLKNSPRIHQYYSFPSKTISQHISSQRSVHQLTFTQVSWLRRNSSDVASATLPYKWECLAEPRTTRTLADLCFRSWFGIVLLDTENKAVFHNIIITSALYL